MNLSSKFAPKAHEGFLLGYGLNSHTYRVYNSHLGKVVETVIVRFDETNGSQREHFPLNLDEPPLDEMIRSMATGDIRPVEGNPRKDHQDDDDPMFPHIARGAGDQQPDGNAGQDEEEANPEGNADPEDQANPEGQANPKGEADAEGKPDPQEDFPRVRRRVDIDSILEEINQP